MPLFHPCPRFGLRQKQPLAIEIKPVVIRSRESPIKIVFDMGRISNVVLAAIGVEPGDSLGVTVGVENCRDQNNAVVQDGLYVVTLRGSEVVDEGQ